MVPSCRSIILICFFSVSACFGPQPTARGQWSAPIQLSLVDTAAHLNENMGQCLAVSGDSLHVVWWDTQNGRSVIYYTHSFDGGVTWSKGMQMTNVPDICDFPSVTVSGNIVHIAYRDTVAGAYTTFYRRSLDGGTTWQTPVSLGNYYWWPSITCSGSMVFVALNDLHPGNTEVYCRRSIDNGATWDTVHQISNAMGRSEDPSIAAANGCVHLAWNDNRTGIMQTWYRRSTDNGITWGPETQVTNAAHFAYSPMLLASGDQVDLAWEDRDANNIFHIMYTKSTDLGATWGIELQLDNHPTGSGYPVLAKDGETRSIVWGDFNGDLYYEHSYDGGNVWQPELDIVSAGSTHSAPFIVTSNLSTHIIWLDTRSGHPAIWFMRDSTTSQSAAEAQSAASRFSIEVYPNPVRGRAKIFCSQTHSQSGTMTVTDALGRTVQQLTHDAALGSWEFDASSFLPGIYFCRVLSQEYSATTKFVIER